MLKPKVLRIKVKFPLIIVTLCATKGNYNDELESILDDDGGWTLDTHKRMMKNNQLMFCKPGSQRLKMLIKLNGEFIQRKDDIKSTTMHNIIIKKP